MNLDKEKLRQELVSLRLNMSKKSVAAQSQIITDKLINFVEWQQIHSVHIYSANPSWNEVDTSQIIKEIKIRWPHIQITSPLPHKQQPIPTEQFDLIIVPVLGFDKDNYRLGMGGGWYDRFLVNQSNAQKIGLAYKEAQLDSLPHESHDIPVDYIITD